MAKYANTLGNPRIQEIIHIFLTNQAEGMPPPTIRDIIVLTDITSTSVVNYYCQQLVELEIFAQVQSPSSTHKKYVIANKGWIKNEIYNPPHNTIVYTTQDIKEIHPKNYPPTLNPVRYLNLGKWQSIFHDSIIYEFNTSIYWQYAQSYPLTNNDSRV